MYNKYVERLKQSVKDVESDVYKNVFTDKYEYLYHRCKDIIKYYYKEYEEHIDYLWEESKNEEEKKEKEKENNQWILF